MGSQSQTLVSTQRQQCVLLIHGAGKISLEGTNRNIFSFVGHGASVTAVQVKAVKTMYKQMRLELTGW